MSRVIFDIETVGVDFDTLDEERQAYLLRNAETEAEEEAVKEQLGLSPLTGEIVAIGMLNPDTERGVVLFQAPEKEIGEFDEGGITFKTGSEKEILQEFWETINRYNQFVTFNGRGFDCPFIMIRSAINRIKPTRDLMPNRYNGPHIDLLDQLSFFGATRRYSLDMWCRSLGIKSSKEEGITGLDVKELFTEGRYLDIARYCARDL
ncbi:MAG: 3'-5' exonuclease, partial [Nitrospirae bacterium]